MDAAGNATLQSPHENTNNYWVFDSKNSYTGKSLLVDMELMMKKLNAEFGWDYIHETIDGVATPNSGTLVSLQDLNLRVNALEATSLNIGTGTSTGILDAVLDGLKALGVEIKQGMVKLANLTVDVLSSKEVYTSKLCLDDICISRDQFKELLDKNGIGASSSASVVNNVGTGSDSTESNVGTGAAETGGSGQQETSSPVEETSPEPEPTPEPTEETNIEQTTTQASEPAPEETSPQQEDNSGIGTPEPAPVETPAPESTP